MTRVRLQRLSALVFILLLVVPAGLRAQQHFPPTEQLELMLRYWVQDGETPGIALAVLEPDGTTRVATYGAGPTGGPVTPETRFPIGEVTMTLTATLLAEMVARGEVSLDDPVAMYMPEGVKVPSLSGYQITLEHLASHRSGLPAEPPAPYDDFDLEALYAFLAEYELDWVPGRARETSVIGYGLLGHVLAGAAGQPFERLLRGRVLEPLGMTDPGYGGDVGPGLRGGTGLWSSAADLAAFLAANAGPAESALEQAARATQEVRGSFDPEGEGYGFSWRTMARLGQPLLVTHGGRTPGGSALVTFAPDSAIGTAVLAAASDFNDWAARDLLYFASPPRETVHVEPEVLQEYVGSYGSRDGLYRATPNSGEVFIRFEDDGHLTYQPRGQLRTPLFPLSDSTFYMTRAPLTVTFDRVGDNMEMTVVTDEREPESVGRTWRRWRVDTSTPRPDVAAGNALPWTAWGTGTWLLVGLVGGVAVVLILRPLWPRRAVTP